MLLAQRIKADAVRFERGAKVFFSVRVLAVNVAEDMKLSFLNYDRFVAQLDRNYLAQFHYLCPGFLFQIRRNRLFFQSGVRSIGQDLRELLDLIIRQAHTTVRREGANLR